MSPPRTSILLACATLVAWLAPGFVSAEPAGFERLRAVDASFRKDVAPLLENHCLDCHSSDDPSGGIVLDRFASLDELFSGVKTWQKAADTQRQKRMPPADYGSPEQADRDKIVAFAEELAAALDATEPYDPGPIVFRRLNRKQYGATIRDLFGIDFDVATAVGLPHDPEAFGYDSIGSALDIPPTLMEKYVAAADETLARVVATPQMRQRFEFEQQPFELLGQMPEEDSKDGKAPPASSVEKGFRKFLVNAETDAPLQIEEAGYYRVEIRGWGHKGPRWVNWQPQLSVKVNGQIRKSMILLGDEEKPAAARTSVYLPAGEVQLKIAFHNAVHGARWQNNDHRFRYAALDYVEVRGPVARSGVKPDPEAHARIFFVEPSETVSEADAAEQILRRFALRAFRRPPGDEEIARLMGFYKLARERKAGHAKGVKLAIKGVLLSPHFLFRIESDRGPEGQFGVHRISDYELATRLSYFLWGSMPDDELFRLAGEGKLSEPEVLKAQVKRMLEDERADSLVHDFAAQWLHLDELDKALPSEEFFPDFTARARTAMRTEVLLFWENLLRKNRSVIDLIDSDYSYTNRDLTRIYRYGGYQHEFVEVEINKRRNPERGGLLGMGAVLAMTSHVSRNSPTRRGKWVLDVLLGDPPPPPPANVEQIDEGADKASAKSFRELLAIHADESSTCAGCHRKMDPLGFALDNFNPIGRFEKERAGKPVQATGVLPGGREINGVIELKEVLLADKERFVRNLTEQMMIYALGRELHYYDRPTVSHIVNRMKENDYRVQEMIYGIVESRAFQFRRQPDFGYTIK